jgi:hypothetical protein
VGASCFRAGVHRPALGATGVDFFLAVTDYDTTTVFERPLGTWAAMGAPIPVSFHGGEKSVALDVFPW